jgi:hypothetical protein
MALQDLLLHVWRNTSRGVYLNAQKRPAVFAVRWQQHEQCLSAQFQRRLILRGGLQEIAWLSSFDSSNEFEAGAGDNGGVVRMLPSGPGTAGDEI